MVTLFSVYSVAEYCVPAWCRRAHIHLIDVQVDNALGIVSGCLRSTIEVYLPILVGSQPAELRRKVLTLGLSPQQKILTTLFT